MAIYLLNVAPVLMMITGSEVDLRAFASPEFTLASVDSLVSDGYMIVKQAIDSSQVVKLSEELIRCKSASKLDDSVMITMENVDDSERTTFATKSSDSFAQCGVPAQRLAAYYKDRTQIVGARVAHALDALAKSQSSSTPESSLNLSDVVNDIGSDSLDHFHIYSTNEVKGSPTTTGSSSVSIPFHYDMGLFLVLTPGTWVGGSLSQARSDLVIKKRDASEVLVTPSESNSVIILLGMGLTQWMYPQAGLRAALHAVRPIEGTDGSRVMLGRMFIPRAQSVSHGIAFDDFFLSPLRKTSNDPVQANWRRLSEVKCAKGKIYCWMDCMSEPDCGGVPAVCMDSVTKKQCRGDECNTKCKPTCPVPPVVFPIPTKSGIRSSTVKNGGNTTKVEQKVYVVDSNSGVMLDNTAGVSEDLFCEGATSMVMSGFESITSDGAHCIILFFRPWILDTRTKFAIGCIGTFLLGILVEAVITARRWATNRLKTSYWWLKEAIVVLLFALNVAMGYLAMLAAMTFNVEIFVSIVAGIATGHSLFGNSRQPVRESADPCCVTTEANPDLNTSLRNSTGACCCE